MQSIKLTMNWIEIKDAAFIGEMKQESVSNPGLTYIIFKHSTRCSTSRMAKNLFESEWNLTDPVHLVNVVESRAASNAVASTFNVHHESPQVLVIQNGISIYDNSHSLIDAAGIIKMLHSEPTR